MRDVNMLYIVVGGGGGGIRRFICCVGWLARVASMLAYGLWLIESVAESAIHKYLPIPIALPIAEVKYYHLASEAASPFSLCALCIWFHDVTTS